jgi:carboxypeptidase PM20D1
VKRIAFFLGVILLAVVAVVLLRGMRASSRQVQVDPAAPVPIDAERAASTLAGAIRFQTVSNQDPAQVDASQFSGLLQFIAERFPRVHRQLTREAVNDYGTLYTWKGRGAGKPIVLLAHIDVVPVEAGTENNWLQPPFSGAQADGYIWGRGALDDKGSAIAILEAVEHLLGAGFQPERAVYLAFGHDEEVGGLRGAAVMAKLLHERGVEAELVIDEGAILDGMIPGIPGPVASLSVGEKGYASIELSADGAGGHSSVPPPRTTIGRLSAAVAKLERNQMPANLRAAVGTSFDFLVPEMPFGQRLLLANLWLFTPLVERRMAKVPQTNASIRTTTAATIFAGGVMVNVLPGSARAVVNFRILPGDTVDAVVEHVRATINDPGIALRVLDGSHNPSPMSDPEAPAFTRVSRAIRATFPGTVVSPFLSLGATDARWYTIISPNVYRFAPYRLRAEDVARIHGTNERIAVEDYVGMIRFYVELLKDGT